MILINIDRIGLVAAQQVDTRDNDMDMGFAVDHLTSFPVSDSLHFGQMRFGIQIKFFRLVRMHEKILKVGRHCFKQLR
ncbi:MULTISPECIES: hypothetical protein [Pseudomonas syringae group]|uniref:hypothetical protein n=1 Tax=Pseudomonas syringae group TaxID=136849 RepID=UPI000517A125